MKGDKEEKKEDKGAMNCIFRIYETSRSAPVT